MTDRSDIDALIVTKADGSYVSFIPRKHFTRTLAQMIRTSEPYADLHGGQVLVARGTERIPAHQYTIGA